MTVERTGAPQLGPDNPWPGPAAYDIGSGDYFQGRDDEKSELLRLVTQFPHVALYGKSGLGKSSLLQAGLFPRLKELKAWLPVYLRLDFGVDAAQAPLQQVLTALVKALGDAGAEFTPPHPGETLWHYLHRRDLELWSADDYPLVPVFVFDQFEELFAPRPLQAPTVEAVMADLGDLIESRVPAALTSGADARERLGAMALDKRRYVTLISFREDSLAAFKNWESRIPSLLRNFLALRPMSRKQAMQAVAGPGRDVIEPGVETNIVNFVGNLGRDASGAIAEDHIEPVLLSLCCTQLNSRRAPGRRIDADLVSTVGQNILDDYYRDALAGLSPTVPLFIENTLVQGTRYRASYPVELALGEGHLTTADLRTLTNEKRLLRVDAQSGVARVELIHDRLVGAVVAAKQLRAEQAAEAAAAARLKAQADQDAENAEEARRVVETQRLRRDRKRLGTALATVALFAATAIVMAWIAFTRQQEATRFAKESMANAAQAAAAAASATQLARLADEKTAEARKLAVDLGRVAADEIRLRDKAEKLRQRAESAERKARDASRLEVARRLGTESDAMLAGVRAGGEETALRMLIAAHRIAPQLDAINAQLLEALTRQADLIRVLPQGGRVAAFLPQRDQIIGVDARDRPQRWDLATGQPVGSRFERAPGTGAADDDDERQVMALAVSPDGRVLATAGSDNQVRLWQVDSGRLLQQLPQFKDWVRAVVFNPDGQRFYTGDDTGTLGFWHTDGRRADDGLRACEEGVYVHALAASPDGKRVAVGCEGEIVHVDVQERRIVARQPAHGDKEVFALAYSPDGRWLLSGGGDKEVRLWDADSGLPFNGKPLVPHDDAVHAVAWHPDSSSFASGSEDKTVRLWQRGQSSPQRSLRRQEAGVTALAFSADGGRLLAASSDGSTRLVDPRGGTGPGNPLRPPGVPRGFSAVRMTGPDLVYGITEDGRLVRWDLTKGARTLVIGEQRPGASPLQVTLSALDDGFTRLVLINRENSAASFSLPGGAAAGQPFRLGTSRARAIAISPDGERLAVAHDDRSLSLWSTASGQPLAAPVKLPQRAVRLGFGAGGRRLVAALTDGSLLQLSARTGQPEGEPFKPAIDAETVTAFVFSPSGDRLAWSDSRGSIRIQPLRDPRPAPLMLRGHSGRVQAMAFSADGQRIASGGEDRTVRLWQAQTGQPIGIPMSGHQNVVTSVGFAPDGSVVVSGSRDRTLRVWPAFERWASLLCDKLSFDIGAPAWNALVGSDIAYVKPCPGKPDEPAQAGKLTSEPGR